MLRRPIATPPATPPADPRAEGPPEWQNTCPAPLDLEPVELPPPARPAPRQQPPLKEVLKGLDSRELEGQTVFDQLFGPPIKR